jgi:hypothetical protein
VSLRDIQQQLRSVFEHWGLPRRIRVDNGKPWGTWNDLPPVFSLWLIGLGIEMIWNRPGHPEENGTVERSQGTSKRWVEPKKCFSAEELQKRLDEMDRIQREEYPTVASSRRALHPKLEAGGTPYRCDEEEEVWDLGRVERHLESCPVQRKVDSHGKTSVYSRRLGVGWTNRGIKVCINYDASMNRWLVQNEAGVVIREIAAPEINRENIRELRLCCGDSQEPKPAETEGEKG